MIPLPIPPKDDPAPVVPAGPPRSTFVTVLAAVFLMMSGSSAAMGLLQIVMVYFMFPNEVFRQAATDPNIPPAAAFLFQYLRVFFLFFFIVSLAMLAASIGLLQRREWGRKLFIAMMCLSVAWDIAGAAFMIAFVSNMAEMTAGASADKAQQIRVMQYGIIGFGTAFSAIFLALHLWIILRLSRESVRAEFAASRT